MKYIFKEKSDVNIDKSYVGSYLISQKDGELLLEKGINPTRIMFSKFIDVLHQLYKIAIETCPTKNPYLVISQYGRSVKYGGGGTIQDSLWNAMCGIPPTEFVNKAKNEFGYFPYLETVLLPSGEEFEVPHFWAAVNGLLIGSHDACGWAGDLVTFAKDVKENGVTKFPSASFGMSDWCADVDALYFAMLFGNTAETTIDLMAKYYNYKLDENKRAQIFKDIYSINMDSSIAKAFKTCIDYENALPLFGRSPLELLMGWNNVEFEDIKNASYLMVEYLDKFK